MSGGVLFPPSWRQCRLLTVDVNEYTWYWVIEIRTVPETFLNCYIVIRFPLVSSG
jgi:hypothetical protein